MAANAKLGEENHELREEIEELRVMMEILKGRKGLVSEERALELKGHFSTVDPVVFSSDDSLGCIMSGSNDNVHHDIRNESEELPASSMTYIRIKARAHNCAYFVGINADSTSESDIVDINKSEHYCKP